VHQPLQSPSWHYPWVTNWPGISWTGAANSSNKTWGIIVYAKFDWRLIFSCGTAYKILLVEFCQLACSSQGFHSLAKALDQSLYQRKNNSFRYNFAALFPFNCSLTFKKSLKPDMQRWAESTVPFPSWWNLVNDPGGVMKRFGPMSGLHIRVTWATLSVWVIGDGMTCTRGLTRIFFSTYSFHSTHGTSRQEVRKRKRV
jgi:hypothetical protein